MILWLDLKNPRDDVNNIQRLWLPMNSILNTSSNTSTNTNVNANVSLLWMVIRNIDITNYTSKSIYPSSNSKISHCSCHSRNSRGANICNFHCLVQVMRGLAKRKEIYKKNRQRLYKTFSLRWFLRTDSKELRASIIMWIVRTILNEYAIVCYIRVSKL